MIDEGSASASEILSGAIQDWDRGIIVGRRSYGKGLVQKPLLLLISQ
jgi:carboxyl-terminal processing protease